MTRPHQMTAPTRSQRAIMGCQINLSYVDVNIGRDGSVLDREQIRQERIRLGYCTECRGRPVRLYNIKKAKYNPLWSAKEALNVEGESLNGACLQCHPELDPNRRGRRLRPGPTNRRNQDGRSSMLDMPPTASGLQASPVGHRPIQSMLELGYQPRHRDLSGQRHQSAPIDAEVSRVEEVRVTPSEVGSIPPLPLGIPNGASLDLRISSDDAIVHGDIEDDDYMEQSGRNLHEASIPMNDSDHTEEDHDSLEIIYSRCRRLSSMRNLRQNSMANLATPPVDASSILSSLIRSASHASSTATPPLAPENEPTSASTPPQAEQRSMRRLRIADDTSTDRESPLSPPSRQSAPPPPPPAAASRPSPRLYEVPAPSNYQTIVAELESLVKDVSAAGNTDFTSDLLVGAMKDYRDAVRVQLFCLGTIWDLCKDSDAYKASLISTSAPEDILLSMKTHMGNPEIQERACGALWSLSVNQHNRIIVIRAGAPARIIKALAEHRYDENVVRTGMGCLRTLSPESEVRESMGALDGMRHICEAMSSHRSVACIQRDGCAFLSNTAVDLDKQQVSLASDYEFEAIVNAMAAHKDDPSVMAGACFALKNYTFEEDNVRSLCNVEEISKLLEDASQYSEDSNCRRDASIVLERVTNSKLEDESLEDHVVSSMKDVIRQNPDSEEAVQQVLDLMREYDWSARINVSVIECLIFLVNENTSHRLKINDLVVQNTANRMRKHLKNPSLQMKACEFLEIMVNDNMTCLNSFIQSGGCKIVVDIVREHLNNVEVQIAATGLLKALSKEFECWFELQRLQFGISEILVVHPDSQRVQQNGSDIMTNFSVYGAART